MTGGWNSAAHTSAEVLFPNGDALCQIKSLPQTRRYHTQSGLTACGGYEGDAKRSCVKRIQDGVELAIRAILTAIKVASLNTTTEQLRSQ